MEERNFYASDDRSSIELIEQEFALSQARAEDLRRRHDDVRFVNKRFTQAVLIMLVVLVLLALLTNTIPDMR